MNANWGDGEAAFGSGLSLKILAAHRLLVYMPLHSRSSRSLLYNASFADCWLPFSLPSWFSLSFNLLLLLLLLLIGPRFPLVVGVCVKIATPTTERGQLRPRPSSSPSSSSKTMVCAGPSSSSCLSWVIRPWRHPGTVIEICSENIVCAWG